FHNRCCVEFYEAKLSICFHYFKKNYTFVIRFAGKHRRNTLSLTCRELPTVYLRIESRFAAARRRQRKNSHFFGRPRRLKAKNPII
ncbi:MAG: hypothetical protein K2N86_00055, partial [Rikenellaceae bacterium]|nr:hypothetical protein [Rikenellaceae bacterium]